MNIILTKKKKRLFAVPLIAAGVSNQKVIYLEMGGPAEARRAIWAHLVKGKDGKNQYVWTNASINGTSLFMDGRYTYFSAHQSDRTVLMHPDMGRMSMTYIYGGSASEVPPYFARAMSHINVPLLPEWLPSLWQKGHAEGTINLLTISHNGPFWSISQNQAAWRSLVKTHVLS